ncbi:type IV secretory system conjugative DNA transfer family protein [Tardiphaga sp. P9-11]|uniref:type IV secretory system conjugative DNA transfer family protein n=1 Tax=Tardiphaga sp. P9-11 TaxID=2024614 RepID=UPI0011F37D53|nr:type IV secretory system conjugative DNA transfer family protein [Tardiphaga sp. P9-11]KAA0069969.1 hypothetical protein CIW50_27760 [Tardiphaga sp. P9-11]
MSGSLLKEGADAEELQPLWRGYWAHSWDRMPDWIRPRLDGFMRADDGRKDEYFPLIDPTDPDEETRLNRPSIVRDYPDGRGPLIGAITHPKESSGIIQFREPGHLLTVAPTRTGKGTGHIVPNLLLYAGSAVVIDIKGENFAKTAASRREMFENAAVFRFAPFEEDTHRYNPLDFVRSVELGGPSADTFDDARLLAEMLIPGGKSNEPYWDIEARSVATMLVMYVAISKPRGSPTRNMAEVSRLLFGNDVGDAEEGDKDGFSATLNEISAYAQRERYAPLMSLVSGFRDHERKLRASILSSCRADLRIWTSPRLQNATTVSDFQFDELKASMCRPVSDAPAPTTLYIVIPPEYLQSYRSVLRTFIGLAVIQLTREADWKFAADLGWRERPPCPVMFLLDELPALGRMDPIVNGLSYLAGYDVQLWSFVQNLGQLKELYGDAWHNFPANAAVTSFFGVNDQDTAEYVSRQLGMSEEFEKRVVNRSATASQSIGRSYTDGSSYSGFGLSGGSSTSSTSGFNSGESESTGLSESRQLARETLASPADVRATHKDLQYVFIRNRPPILSTRIDYFNFPLFENLYGRWREGDQ